MKAYRKHLPRNDTIQAKYHTQAAILSFKRIHKEQENNNMKLCRLKIGHRFMTHDYLIIRDKPPKCCDKPLLVKKLSDPMFKIYNIIDRKTFKLPATAIEIFWKNAK